MQTSNNQDTLTPAQVEFMDAILFYGVSELSRSLKIIHDIALYHSDVPLDKTEKSALYDVKVLWEVLEELGKEK